MELFGITPRNARQSEYLRCLESAPHVIATGPAGTAKTFLAAVYAAALYNTPQRKKIVLCRPPEGPGKGLGFLPGELEEKLAPWVRPTLSVLESCLGKGVVECGIKKGNIELLSLEHIKGRDFQNCFIICDEVEDIDIATARSLVTRVGEYSTLVMAGDLAQCHLRRESGLKYLIDIIDKHGLPVPVIEFTMEDCQRGPTTRMWLEAFQNEL